MKKGLRLGAAVAAVAATLRRGRGRQRRLHEPEATGDAGTRDDRDHRERRSDGRRHRSRGYLPPDRRRRHDGSGAGNEDRHRRGAGLRARARRRAAATRRRHPDRPARRGGATTRPRAHRADPDDHLAAGAPGRRSTINLPVFILPTVGAETALGQGKIVFCLAPPDIPVASGGATFGAKFLSAKLTLNAVVQAVPAGVFLTFRTPWQAGNGKINAAGTVASPAAVAPGAVASPRGVWVSVRWWLVGSPRAARRAQAPRSRSGAARRGPGCASSGRQRRRRTARSR